IVAKDYPAGVGDDLLIHLRVAEIDVRRDLVHQVRLAGRVAAQRGDHEDSEDRDDADSAHEDKDITSAGHRFRKYGHLTQCSPAWSGNVSVSCASRNSRTRF